MIKRLGKNIFGEAKKANVPDVNGNIYSRECLEKAIIEYNKKENKFGVLFDKEECNNIDLLLKNVCFGVKEIKLNMDSLCVEGIILENSFIGKNINELLKEGDNYDFSFGIAGVGNVGENKLIKNFEITRVSIVTKEDIGE